MSLTTDYERAGNASLTYFKGLMHAGDALLCVENENWVPAAVSLYYSIFDLAVSAILASEYDRDVDYEDQCLPLVEAIIRGADPYHYISHREALNFARQEMEQGFYDALNRLHELREFASYHPRRTVLPDGRRWINTCAIDAPRFICQVQRESRELGYYFHLFHNYLRVRGRANPAHEAYFFAEADIEQHADDPIRELGHYRNERAITLARELHTAVFPIPNSRDP